MSVRGETSCAENLSGAQKKRWDVVNAMDQPIG
jgi:hypothetical protein